MKMPRKSQFSFFYCKEDNLSALVIHWKPRITKYGKSLSNENINQTQFSSS